MHITVVKADVICLVEDGKSTICEVLCVADVISRWQMEYHQGGGLQML